MFSSSGYSKAAQNRVERSPIKLDIITIEEAGEFNLCERARLIYPCDLTFHPAMGKAYYELEKDNIPGFISALENVSFEEWLGLMRDLLSDIGYHSFTVRALKEIASNYPDNSWRYNAVELLNDSGELDLDFIKLLLKNEADGVNVERLKELKDEFDL